MQLGKDTPIRYVRLCAVCFAPGSAALVGKANKSNPPHVASGSITRFTLVANGHDDRGLTIIAVQRDITAATKGNRPLPVFGFHVCDRSPDFGMLCEDIDAQANKPDGLLSRNGIFCQ